MYISACSPPLRMNYTDSRPEYILPRDYFGNSPEQILLKHYLDIDSNQPVLDIGAGPGRHAVFMARKGFVVHALDPVKEVCNSLLQFAKRQKLDICTHQQDFESYTAPERFFSAILNFGLIPVLSQDQIDKLVTRNGHLVASGGLIFVTAFTVEDPGFAWHSKQWKPCGKNSFTAPNGELRTYLGPQELKNLFSDFEVIDFKEYTGPEHRHGSGPLHHHHWAEAVFKAE